MEIIGGGNIRGEMMRLPILALFFLFIAVSCVSSQAPSANHSLFVGTWTLNHKKSSELRLPDSADWTIEISSLELQLSKVINENKKSRAYSMTFYTDGRGETNTVPMVNRAVLTNIRSRTKWNKNVLVRSLDAPMTGVGPRGSVSGGLAEVTEKYSL